MNKKVKYSNVIYSTMAVLIIFLIILSVIVLQKDSFVFQAIKSESFYTLSNSANDISSVKIPKVTKISFKKKNVTGVISNNIQLEATISPNKVSKSVISWSSSNKKIATVNNNGLVSPKRSGTVTITAAAGSVKSSATVTIKGNRIHFINIHESGDATLLESNGKFALVDTGNLGYTNSRKYFLEYLDELGIKELEFIVLTHNHADHIGGMGMDGKATSVMDKGFTVKKIYMKTYTGKDSSAQTKDGKEAMMSQYLNIIENAKKHKVKIVYVDEDTFFKEKKGKSGVVQLNEMRVYFFNTVQRNEKKGKGNPFNYYTSNNFAVNNTENLNSIVNLVRVNGHNALLTGDLNDYKILKGVFDNKVKVVYSSKEKLDVYKVPHHANFNCTGNQLYSVKASYYVVSNSVDEIFSNGNGKGYRITPDQVTYKNKKVESCFYLMSKKNKSNAKKMMCNAYYANNSNKAVIFDFSQKKVKITGGGKGQKNSSRC